MNTYLENAQLDAAKADALCFAIDDLFMEEAEDRMQYLFQTLWDLIKKINGVIEKASEDRRMVDVIYAVNNVRRIAGED